MIYLIFVMGVCLDAMQRANHVNHINHENHSSDNLCTLERFGFTSRTTSRGRLTTSSSVTTRAPARAPKQILCVPACRNASPARAGRFATNLQHPIPPRTCGYETSPQLLSHLDSPGVLPSPEGRGERSAQVLPRIQWALKRNYCASYPRSH